MLTPPCMNLGVCWTLGVHGAAGANGANGRALGGQQTFQALISELSIIWPNSACCCNRLMSLALDEKPAETCDDRESAGRTYSRSSWLSLSAFATCKQVSRHRLLTSMQHICRQTRQRVQTTEDRICGRPAWSASSDLSVSNADQAPGCPKPRNQAAGAVGGNDPCTCNCYFLSYRS